MESTVTSLTSPVRRSQMAAAVAPIRSCAVPTASTNRCRDRIRTLLAHQCGVAAEVIRQADLGQQLFERDQLAG